jgi:hypothetical protein
MQFWRPSPKHVSMHPHKFSRRSIMRSRGKSHIGGLCLERNASLFILKFQNPFIIHSSRWREMRAVRSIYLRLYKAIQSTILFSGFLANVSSSLVHISPNKLTQGTRYMDGLILSGWKKRQPPHSPIPGKTASSVSLISQS